MPLKRTLMRLISPPSIASVQDRAAFSCPLLLVSSASGHPSVSFPRQLLLLEFSGLAGGWNGHVWCLLVIDSGKDTHVHGSGQSLSWIMGHGSWIADHRLCMTVSKLSFRRRGA